MFGPAAKAIVAAVLVPATHHARERRPPRLPSDLGEEFVPRPGVAKLAALGFDSALADYYWLRAVQIVGGEEAGVEKHAKLLGRMIDVVTTLDPWVDHPYRFAAVWLTASPESVRKANELLRRGIEHHPDEWRNRFYLGFNLYFYLGEHAEAADVLEEAARLPGAPKYLPRLVARLRSHADDLETAAVFLFELAKNASDEERRATYLDALDELQIERRARILDAARERYVERRGRDIERVEDLVAGPQPVLAALPDPLPDSIPQSLRREARWVVDEKSGRIVSDFYGRRYALNFHAREAARRQEWLGEKAEGGNTL